MKTQIDIPYGTSDFRSLILEKMYYVDRTNYIEKLEGSLNKYIFFLRPRRFGKSLLISMLNYYYGVQYKNEFDSLFGELYIGKNPTENRNNYYILKFDFSGIDTTAIDQVPTRFNEKILSGLEKFNHQYKLLNEVVFNEIAKHSVPAATINDFFTKVEPFLNHKIFVLIDEYDHFTNEILAFRFDAFSDAVSKNGFVRKFYENIKASTGGTVDRFFATGVTPVTLDSMTSGFNIATNISTDAKFNEMAGFTTEEVKQMVFDLFPGIEENSAKKIMRAVAKWFNGSLFSSDATIKLYNPAMLLRFISQINSKTFKLPREQVDVNILSDFTKINNLAKIGNYDDNLEAIGKILREDVYATFLTQMFTFERKMKVPDFISLLYYHGLLTIKGAKAKKILFAIPNQVIKEVYWGFFAEVLSDRYSIQSDTEQIEEAVELMAAENNIVPLMKIIEGILKQLSNRDLNRFDEKYIKLVIILYVSLTRTYDIVSEREVNMKYPDLLFLGDALFIPEYQHLFELKYIKKEEISKLESVKSEGIKQVKMYMELEDMKKIENLKCWLIIFSGTDCVEIIENCI